MSFPLRWHAGRALWAHQPGGGIRSGHRAGSGCRGCIPPPEQSTQESAQPPARQAGHGADTPRRCPVRTARVVAIPVLSAFEAETQISSLINWTESSYSDSMTSVNVDSSIPSTWSKGNWRPMHHRSSRANCRAQTVGFEDAEFPRCGLGARGSTSLPERMRLLISPRK